MAVLSRTSRRLAGPWLGLVLAFGGMGAHGAEPGERSLELAVKATYLYKLAPFVSWPTPSAHAQALAICVQGADPFGGTLDRAVAGQQVGERALVVRRIDRLVPGGGCDIAYIGGSAVQSQDQALRAVAGAPVLTVTDESQGRPRGVVHLLLDGGKVRFAIDLRQAQSAGLAISSKLLALAVRVVQ